MMRLGLGTVCLAFSVTVAAAENPVADESQLPADAAQVVEEASDKADDAGQSNSLIRRMIRGLWGPTRTDSTESNSAVNDEPEEESRKSSRVNPSDRDYIDSRAPHTAKVEQQLRSAQDAIKKRDWKMAVELLQQLLDLPEDSLHRLPNGRWQSLRRTASRLLGQTPAEVLNDYQQQNNGLARQLLSRALEDGDLAGVTRVATRYFHTEAGYQAADYLASHHQDRAEFSLASVWVKELESSRAEFVRSTPWRTNAAALYRMAGQTKAANSILKKLAAEKSRIIIGGRNVDPKEWVNNLQTKHDLNWGYPNDWPQIYGTSNRLAFQDGWFPFLMPKWHIPYSRNHFIQQRVDWILQDLADENLPVVMAAQPLAVNGKGIYRDLHGLRVIDLKTGQNLWDGIEGTSAERILIGQGGADEEDSSLGLIEDSNEAYTGQDDDNHPLVSLMLRDAVYNTLSSDGKQVFVIEDQGILSRQQPGWNWGWEDDQENSHGFSWTTNRLSSYELETGRLLWTVGGPDSQESFRLPMSGVYFLGAPTPDGEELFVIGSRGDEIRLWCLDRRTGGPLWSQLIAYADTKIDQDIGRRWQAALPSVSEGIVVCPTTVGWLVAVDRLTHAVLWAHRYSTPQTDFEDEPANHFAPQHELGDQWAGSAPVIAGQKVLFTPTEDNLLACVDLVTGALRWKIWRTDGQYLAGVAFDRVVVVGLHQVTGYSLDTGKNVWKHQLETGVMPSGRAVLTDDNIIFPLNTGELRGLDYSYGNSVSHWFGPAGQPPLGNLLMHQGMMISLGPSGMTSFRQLTALQDEIEQRYIRNPRDAEALLSEAEIALLRHDGEEALPLLRRISPEKLTADQQARLHKNLVEALTGVIRNHLAESESDLAELGRLATTPEEKLLHLDLSAERWLALGQHPQAFSIFWTLAGETFSGQVSRTDDSKVSVERTIWLSGRLKDVWSTADRESRQQIDARLAEIVAAASHQPEAARRRLVELIGFHPSAQPMLRQLIEEQIARDETVTAELELLRLSESPDREQAAWATVKLAELMDLWKLPNDAAAAYHRLKTEYADIPLPNGQTGAERVEALQHSGRMPTPTEVPPLAWDERMLKVMQLTYQYYGQPNQEIVLEDQSPWWKSLDIDYLSQEQRLTLNSRSPDGYRWLVPLRIGANNQYYNTIHAKALGHSLVVNHHNVLHFLSPIQKQLLWSLPLEGLTDGGLPASNSVQSTILPMWDLTQSSLAFPMLELSTSSDRLSVVQPGYLAVQTRRTLHVLDSRTGAEMWRRKNVTPHSEVLGGSEIVWLIPPQQEKILGYRVRDGAPLQVEQVDKHLKQTIDLVGDDFLILEPGTGLRFFGWNRTKIALRRYNPLAKTDVWKQEFSPGTWVGSLGPEELLVVQPTTGKVERVQKKNGTNHPLASVSPKDLRSHDECYTFADEERIYLLVNSLNGNHSRFPENLHSVNAHGTIFTWDRATGELLWKSPIEDQQLILERFRRSPVLVFCSREWKQKENLHYAELSLKVLQKQTGKVLHESLTPTMYSGFQSLVILPDEHSLELRSHNLKMKLVPKN